MRRDFELFTDRNVEILFLGPDSPSAFKKYWRDNNLPFSGCADIQSKIAASYYQEINLLKLGRMPALFVIDLEGKIRFLYYSNSMSDIPDNKLVLEAVDHL